MNARALILALTAFLALPGWDGTARAGRGFLRADDPGDGDAYINLIVRVLMVSPIRAHVGDVISFDMIIENQSDASYETTTVKVLANGRRVASRLFTYGFTGEPGKIHREAFAWDTRGAAPGEYRIRGEVFLWHDASPFDNSLEVEQPLVLLPRGTPFPESEEAGGSAMAVDPRYKGPLPQAGGSAAEAHGT